MSFVSSLNILKPICQIDYNKDQSIERIRTNKSLIILRTYFVAIGATLATSCFSKLTLAKIYALPLFGYAYYQFEKYRTLNKINHVILNEFKSQKPVLDSCVMDYVAQSPNLLKQILPISTNKTNSQGQSIADRIINNVIYNQENAAQAFNILVHSNHKFTAEQIIKIIKSENIQIILPLFDKINMDDFTEENKHDCWMAVKDQRIAQILIKKKINIDALKNGKSPIDITCESLLNKHLILTSEIKNHLYFLVKNGANLSSDYETKIKQALPDIVSCIEQSKLNNLNPTSPLLNKRVSLFNFKEPAVSFSESHKGNDYEIKIERDYLVLRSFMMSIKINALSLLIFYPATPLVPLLVSIALPFFYYKFEISRAEKTINELVVNTLKQMAFPSSNLLNYAIQQDNGQLCVELIEQNFDFTCLANNNEFAWTQLIDGLFGVRKVPFSIFKQIIPFLFKNEKFNKEQQINFFIRILSTGNLEQVNFLLESNYINPASLTPKDQFNCWIAVKSSEMAQLLVKYKFDINSKNEASRTPLMSLFINSTFLNNLDSYDRIKILLEVGADYQEMIQLDLTNNGFLKNCMGRYNNQTILQAMLIHENSAIASLAKSLENKT